MSSVIKKILLIALALKLSTLSAFANDSEVTFEAVLDAALQKSPIFSRIQSRLSKDKAEIKELALIANPEFNAEYRPYVSKAIDQDEEYEISLVQPLKLGDFGKRQKIANLLEKVNSIDEKISLLELSESLKLLYIKAWALQEKERSLSNIEERIKILSDKIKKDLDNGIFPLSSVNLLNASSLKISVQLKSLHAEKNRAKANLTKESGLLLKNQKLRPLILPKIRSNPLTSEDLNKLPLVERIRLRNKIANEQLKLAKLDSFPRFAPRIGFEHTSEGSDSLNVGLAIEIPIFDRNQAGKIRTAANKSEQETLLEYANGEAFKEELIALVEAAQASDREAEVYKDSIIPALRSALTASEKEFAAGQGNAFQSWQILAELIEAEDRYLEVVVAAVSERTDLSIMLGQEI